MSAAQAGCWARLAGSPQRRPCIQKLWIITLHERCAGRLLGTVGRFTAAAAPAPAAAQIAAASAELLCHPSIAGHPEPFVRRSALFAAAQVHDTLSFGARP